MMPIELSDMQQKALDESGPPLRMIDPRSQATYVLVSTDVFDRLTDDTLYTTAEMLDAVMAEDDANDPYLAEYQRLYGDKSQ